MMTEVKTPRRTYRSSVRQAQAQETRAVVLSAAQAVFLEQGWARTTVAAVARAAGVSSETIYARFGSKRALLAQVVAQAVRGADPDTPLIQQARILHIAEQTDQAVQIELFAAGIAGVLARVAPLLDVVRTAAATDAELQDLYLQLHRGRRDNLDWFAQALLKNGPLPRHPDTRAVGAELWRLASPELYLLMRRVEGQSEGDFVAWLTSSLKVLLLGDSKGRGGRGPGREQPPDQPGGG